MEGPGSSGAPDAPNITLKMGNSSPKKFDVHPKTLAAELNVSLQTIQRMCRSEELPALKVRGQWRIREDWRSYLKAQTGTN